MAGREPSPAAYAVAFIKRWYVLGVAGLGAVAVVLGVFEGARPLSWIRVVLGVGVTALVIDDALARVRRRPPARPYFDLEGPLLWVVGAWMVMRLGGSYAGDLTVVGAAVVAWLVAFRQGWMTAVAVSVAGTLELGLAGAKHQDGVSLVIHLGVYAAAAYALDRLARSEVFRRRLAAEAKQDRIQEAFDSRTKDLGLKTEQLGAVRLPGAHTLGNETVGRVALTHLDESFQLQLDLLRDAFELTSAALLLTNVDDAQELKLHSSSSDRTLLPGPYEAGRGLPASVLRGDDPEIAVAPVHRGFSGLPYYADNEGVGAALAVVVEGRDGAAGVLCVDRKSESPWTERERRGLRRAARKLGLDLQHSQRLKAFHHERDTAERFASVLQDLNRVQKVEEAAAVAANAVRKLVSADLVVVSLLQDSTPGAAEPTEQDVHKVVAATGLHGQRYAGLGFTGDEGLVGQAVKLGHALPQAPFKPKQVVFTTSTDKVLSEMRDLRIEPLLRKQGAPIGALTVMSKHEGTFGQQTREMLKLVAQQVATRIDLAQAYDRIEDLAMIDELTRLSNRRTFERAFDKMMKRARRSSQPLSLIITDIDRFKRLNDTYGHPFGDLVLQQVSAILARAVRENDLAARWGGEEFALLVENATEDGAMLLAERIRKDVAALRLDHESGPVRVTLSLGCATYPEDAQHSSDLLARADEALFYAKENGRNRAIAASALRDIPPQAPPTAPPPETRT